MIEKLIHGCPHLEDFRLVYCSGLRSFAVSDLPKLKRVDLHSCKGLKKVKVQATNLETFWYHAKKSRPCTIDLSTCNSLKILTLEDAKLEDELFQNHLSCYPVLEKLVLSKCNALKNITISSFRLKTLILRECKKLEEVDIDTPNLVSFEYKGDTDKMPFSSLNPASLKEAKLYFKSSKQAEARFCNGDVRTPWFARLQEFLEKFDYSKGLKLVARSNKDIVIYEKPKEIFLPLVDGLKLDVVKPSITLEDLLEDILRTWHPQTLSSLSIGRSKLPKDGGKDQPSSKKKMSVVVGPWGGNGGAAWDDGTYHGVREIGLVYDRCIDSIRVTYDKNGKPVTAEKHGGVGGTMMAEIKLKFPEEFLISVSGHFCPVVHGGSPVIRSLTFKSNQRTFGPYGVEEGTPFSFSVEGARIAGFNGRSGWYLDSIGFRLCRVQSPKLFQKVQKGFRRLTSSISISKSSAAA
ncbi:Mannose-binding lectin [Corchorus olitorius]|uniref:Mannose-binding lectin n=1 Tax=Corchorus olitorius TaxID=93759 RepID=A0A1R3H7R1_9ROSI|nr:Mannose-binding lectin [Corchorus olitorius]